MKKPLRKRVFVFFLLFMPAWLFAQNTTTEERDITGLWKGSLYNDTTKKTLPYEIAISESDGKLTGYSYTLFDIDGKKEMGVKKIKIKRKDGQIQIEDIELISNNYSEPPPRKVRMLGILNLVIIDTSMDMSGKWNTNQTKEYRPLTGTMQLHRAADYKPLVLYKKLEELKLEQGLSFVKAENKRIADIAIKEKEIAENKRLANIAAKEKETAENKRVADIATREKEIAENKRLADIATKEKEIAENKRLADIAAKEKEIAEHKRIADIAAKEKEIAENKRLADIAAKEKEIAENKRLTDIAAKEKEIAEKKRLADIAAKEKAAAQVKPPLIVPPAAVKKTVPEIAGKEPAKKEAKPVTPATQTPVAVNTPPVTVVASASSGAAAKVAERKMSNEQSVFFESDSLLLTLYDNGDVDGDTVSVLMNGQIIFAKQGLSTKANSKTVYIDKLSDTISMVMYAENLGSIPPNTGLMIIMDGEKRHEVRFSADLKTNAAILLRRRPKEQ